MFAPSSKIVFFLAENLTLIKDVIDVLSKVNYKPEVKLPVTSYKSPFPESPVTIWMNQGKIQTTHPSINY